MKGVYQDSLKETSLLNLQSLNLSQKTNSQGKPEIRVKQFILTNNIKHTLSLSSSFCVSKSAEDSGIALSFLSMLAYINKYKNIIKEHIRVLEQKEIQKKYCEMIEKRKE